MWMKIDDRLHAHRKTRAVLKSSESKVRDAAPMGLWVIAGSWAAQNDTNGWVPEDELIRWDDNAGRLAKRLVESGYWWAQKRDGEPGYGFNDWHDYNDPANSASRSGTYGNHIRWHVNEAKVDPECDHCPTEPEDPAEEPDDDTDSIGAISGRVAPDIAPESPPESRNLSGAIALPEPEPDPTRPRPEPEKLLSDEPDELDPLDHFDEFWNAYAKKVKRADAERKWTKALKKPGVTPDLLVAAAAEYVTWERANNEGGRYIADPSTWLHGERWTDERTARVQPMTRVQEHLTLVQQLAAEEAAEHSTLEIGQRR